MWVGMEQCSHDIEHTRSLELTWRCQNQFGYGSMHGTTAHMTSKTHGACSSHDVITFHMHWALAHIDIDPSELFWPSAITWISGKMIFEIRLIGPEHTEILFTGMTSKTHGACSWRDAIIICWGCHLHAALAHMTWDPPQDCFDPLQSLSICIVVSIVYRCGLLPVLCRC